MLTGQLAKRLVADGMAGTFDGMKSAADARDRFRFSHRIIQSRERALDSGNLFIQFLEKERADLFVDRCFRRTVGEGGFIGRHGEVIEISRCFPGEQTVLFRLSLCGHRHGH